MTENVKEKINRRGEGLGSKWVKEEKNRQRNEKEKVTTDNQQVHKVFLNSFFSPCQTNKSELEKY